MNIPGSNKRFSDSFSGRSGLLSCVERHNLGGQRGECSPLHQAAGPDYPEKHSWDEAPAWDPQWEGFHLQQYAGAEFHNVKCFFSQSKSVNPVVTPKYEQVCKTLNFGHWGSSDFGTIWTSSLKTWFYFFALGPVYFEVLQRPWLGVERR